MAAENVVDELGLETQFFNEISAWNLGEGEQLTTLWQTNMAGWKMDLLKMYSDIKNGDFLSPC